MRTRVPLFEFMPYGAPELIESGPVHLARAVMTGALGWSVAFAVLAILALNGAFKTAPVPPILSSVFTIDRIPETPPLQPALRLKEPAAKASSPDARPEPVRDDLAPPPEARVDAGTGVEGTDSGTQTGTTEGVGPLAPPTAVIPAVDRPYEVHEVDQQPRVRIGPEPLYPPFAREAQIEGLVVVRALIGRDGKVEEANVVRSVPLLDGTALEAVRRWTFDPARVDGRTVAVWVLIPFRFRLH